MAPVRGLVRAAGAQICGGDATLQGVLPSGRRRQPCPLARGAAWSLWLWPEAPTPAQVGPPVPPYGREAALKLPARRRRAPPSPARGGRAHARRGRRRRGWWESFGSASGAFGRGCGAPGMVPGRGEAERCRPEREPRLGRRRLRLRSALGREPEASRFAPFPAGESVSVRNPLPPGCGRLPGWTEVSLGSCASPPASAGPPSAPDWPLVVAAAPPGNGVAVGVACGRPGLRLVPRHLPPWGQPGDRGRTGAPSDAPEERTGALPDRCARLYLRRGPRF